MKFSIVFIPVIALLLAFKPVVGQESSTDFSYQTWVGIMTSTQISERFSIWNDAHFVHQSFFIYRTGITLHAKENRFMTTVGYARLLLTAPFSDGSLIRNEHRPWGQIIYRIPAGNELTSSVRFRYDARFRHSLLPEELGNDFDLSHRFRFNAVLRYNWGKLISKQHDFTTSLLNESLIMTGPVIDDYLWEHRIFMMFGLNKGGNNYSLGYVMRFMDLNPNLTRINHGLVFWATFHFDLRKIKKMPFKIFPSDHT